MLTQVSSAKLGAILRCAEDQLKKDIELWREAGDEYAGFCQDSQKNLQIVNYLIQEVDCISGPVVLLDDKKWLSPKCPEIPQAAEEE